MTETPTAETFHDAWVGYGMTCGGTHAVGEGLCQNVTAVLAALARSESPSSGARMGTVEQRPPVWIEDPAESPSPEGLRHRLLWPPHPGDVYSSSALCSCGDFQWDADSQGALFNATGDVLSDWTVHAVESPSPEGLTEAILAWFDEKPTGYQWSTGERLLAEIAYRLSDERAARLRSSADSGTEGT